MANPRLKTRHIKRMKAKQAYKNRKKQGLMGALRCVMCGIPAPRLLQDLYWDAPWTCCPVCAAKYGHLLGPTVDSGVAS